MRNWLQDQNQQAWTVVAWVKREQGPYDYVGIVDNGDCKDSASFLLYGNVESGNAVAYGGIAANNGFPATQTGSYVSRSYYTIIIIITNIISINGTSSIS